MTRTALRAFAALVAVVLALAAPEAARAEEADAIAAFRSAHTDFFRDMRRFTPMVEVRGLLADNGRPDSERGEFDLGMIGVEAIVPVPISRDLAVMAGAQTHARRYRFDHEALGANDDTLIGAGLRLGVGAFVGDDLFLQALWMPSIFSDFDGTLTSEDWYLWYGIALATYRLNPKVFLKGGFALTDAFQDTGAVPILGVSWLFADQWRLDILLPRNAEVSFAPTEAWIVHAGFEIEGEEYRMRSTNSGQEVAQHVQAVDTRLFAGFIHRITPNVSFSLRAGFLVGGYYDWKDGTGFDYDGRLEQGVFVAGGVGWTF